MKIPAILQSAYSMANEKVLIDSGVTANFLDQRVAKQLGFKPKKLDCPICHGSKRLWLKVSSECSKFYFS